MIRTPFRSIANSEFHHTDHEITDIGHKIVAELGAVGIAALLIGGYPVARIIARRLEPDDLDK